MSVLFGTEGMDQNKCVPDLRMGLAEKEVALICQWPQFNQVVVNHDEPSPSRTTQHVCMWNSLSSLMRRAKKRSSSAWPSSYLTSSPSIQGGADTRKQDRIDKITVPIMNNRSKLLRCSTQIRDPDQGSYTFKQPC